MECDALGWSRWKLPPAKPVRPREIERRRKLLERTIKLRDEIGPVALTWEKLAPESDSMSSHEEQPVKRAIIHVDVSQSPDLLRLAEEVQASQQPRLLTRDGEELVEMRPAKPAAKRQARGKVLTKDDPLSLLAGSAASAEPTDAAKKHEYLADYLAPQEP